MIAITAKATSAPRPVQSSAASVPALRMETVAMKAVMEFPSCCTMKAEPGLFQSCFASRQNGFVHERVRGWDTRQHWCPKNAAAGGPRGTCAGCHGRVA